jgi:hypothetical protein
MKNNTIAPTTAKMIQIAFTVGSLLVGWPRFAGGSYRAAGVPASSMSGLEAT